MKRFGRVPWAMLRLTCGSSPQFLFNQWSRISLSNLDDEQMPHNMGTRPDSGPQNHSLICKCEQSHTNQVALGTSAWGSVAWTDTSGPIRDNPDSPFYSWPAVAGGHKFYSGLISGNPMELSHISYTVSDGTKDFCFKTFLNFWLVCKIRSEECQLWCTVPPQLIVHF